jgi:hypothetical protein
LSQAWEAVLDPKIWLWVVLAILPNMDSALPSVFGPLIIKGFGFDQYETVLLNLPFGFLTLAVVMGACWVVGSWKFERPCLGCLYSSLRGGLWYALGAASDCS